MTLESLSALVAHVTGASPFYRNHFGRVTGGSRGAVRSWDEWRALPTLAKSDLIGAPLSERSLVGMSGIDYLSSSSGTTGTLPLFSARTQLLEYEFRTRFYEAHGAMLASTPVPHQQEAFLSARDTTPRIVVIDPRNPEATARLAKAAGVDAICAFLFHIPLLIEHLQREGLTEQILYIELTGEACSQRLVRTIKTAFPNAILTSVYGTSEVENSPMGVPCAPLTDTSPTPHYHAKNGIFLELYDHESGSHIEPVGGAEGELLITAFDGTPAAFPFIRYRSGDRVRITETHCAVHGTWSFEVLGRIDMDTLKIPGGTIQADEVERVLRLFPDRVSDIFEMHISERSDTSPHIALHVEAQSGADLSSLALEIADALRIGPSSTYADGVRTGALTPLTLEPLSIRPAHAKRKRIIRHTL